MLKTRAITVSRRVEFWVLFWLALCNGLVLCIPGEIGLGLLKEVELVLVLGLVDEGARDGRGADCAAHCSTRPAGLRGQASVLACIGREDFVRVVVSARVERVERCLSLGVFSRRGQIRLVWMGASAVTVAAARVHVVQVVVHRSRVSALCELPSFLNAALREDAARLWRQLVLAALVVALFGAPGHHERSQGRLLELLFDLFLEVD